MSATINIKFLADLEQFSSQLQNATRDIAKMGKKLSKVGKGLTLGVTAPLTGVAMISLKAAAELETLEVSLESMLGSAEKAKKFTEELQTFTANTPFELQGVGSAAKKLLSFGVAQDAVLGKLKFLGDIAGGANVPLADMASIFGKIKGKGKAMTEEILQLSDRGIPIVKVLAKQFGVAESAIFSMAKGGKISFSSIETALKSMSQKGGIFEDQMKKQSATLAGAFSTLKDNVALSFAEIGKAISETFDLKEVIATLIKKIQGVVTWFKELDGSTRKIIIAVAAFGAVLGPVLVSLGFLMTTVVPGLTVAFGALSTVLMANPIGAIVAVVAALGGAALLCSSRLGSLTDITDEWKDVNRKATESIVEERTELQRGLNIAKDTKRSKAERLAAIKKLKKQYPKYLGFLSLETVNTEKTKKATDALVASLMMKAKVQAAQEKMVEVERKLLDLQLGQNDAMDPSIWQSLGIAMKGAVTGTGYMSERLKVMGKNFSVEKKTLEALRTSLQGYLTDNSGIVAALKKSTKAVTTFNGALAGGSSFKKKKKATTLGAGIKTQGVQKTEKKDFATDIDETLVPLEEKLTNFQQSAEAISASVAGSFESMGGRMLDSLNLADTGFEGFVKNMGQTVVKLVSMLLANATANAIAGATASGTATGPLAIFSTPAFIATAVGGVVSAFAAIPKFETGGIVGGSSFFGDKLLARVNSGELILNERQQGALYNAITPASQAMNVSLAGGVEIDGRKLKFFLKETDNRLSRTS